MLKSLLWVTDAQPDPNQKKSCPLKPPLFFFSDEHDAECHKIIKLLLVRVTCLVVSRPSPLSAHSSGGGAERNLGKALMLCNHSSAKARA